MVTCKPDSWSGGSHQRLDRFYFRPRHVRILGLLLVCFCFPIVWPGRIIPRWIARTGGIEISGWIWCLKGELWKKVGISRHITLFLLFLCQLCPKSKKLWTTQSVKLKLMDFCSFMFKRFFSALYSFLDRTRLQHFVTLLAFAGAVKIDGVFFVISGSTLKQKTFGTRMTLGCPKRTTVD